MIRDTTLWLIVLLCVIGLSANIGGYSIYLLDEAKNAECAREMLETQEWVVPTFNYQLREDKPPLHYYFMVTSYTIFGVNEFAARFFSMIFGCLTLVITYLFSRTYFDKRTATYTGLVLLSSLGFILQFRLAVPDPYLVFFMTASILSFYHGYKSKNSQWLYLFYVLTGMSVLTKGPIGLVIPLMIISAFYFIRKPVFDLKIGWGLIIIVLLVGPWYTAVAVKTDGEWLWRFLFEHNIERFMQVKEGHGGWFLMAPIYFLLLLLPLGVFIFPAMRDALIMKKNEAMTLSLIAIAAIVGFFSLSATKLPNYVSPALPFGAILIGHYLANGLSKNGKVSFTLILYMLISSLMQYGLYHGLKNYSLGIPIWPFYLLPLGAVVVNALWWFQYHKIALWSVGMSFLFSLILAFYFVIPPLDNFNPVKRSLGHFQTEAGVVAYHIFNPAFSFYVKKEIPVFTELNKLSEYLGNNQSVVITRSSTLEDLKALELDTLIISQDLFENTSTAILSKKK